MPLKKKWIIIGDSISDAGCTDGILPWGNGYANYFFRWLITMYPHLNLECHNKGICGNTIRGLKHRWENDVLTLSPDYLIVYIGVNDAHQAMESPDSLENIISSFQNTYLAMLQKVQIISSPKIILITPFYCHNDQSLLIFNAVSGFAEAVRYLASETNSQLLDLNQIFAELAHKEKDFRKWSADSVHPTDLGHRLISEKLQTIASKFLPQ